MAVNSLGSSQLNSFSFSFSFCHLTFLASFLYFFSNSLTSSFVFSKFSLPSYISTSIVYPFHYTKNLFFSCTFLLFRIFSTLYFSSLFITTGYSDTILWSSTWGSYNCTLLMLTTGCILIVRGNSSLIVFIETTLFTLYRSINHSISFSILLFFICYFKSFVLNITRSLFWYSSSSLLFLSAYCFIFSCAFFNIAFTFF